MPDVNSASVTGILEKGCFFVDAAYGMIWLPHGRVVALLGLFDTVIARLSVKCSLPGLMLRESCWYCSAFSRLTLLIFDKRSFASINPP